jgi:uncharacterized protein
MENATPAAAGEEHAPALATDEPVTAAGSTESAAAGAEMTPIAANQRIEALDVVRGFALLCIFLMNIEFFNRTFASFNEGMPRGLTGMDWVASWFIAYFVQGKFWTIFSLLFGMGFAVMMVRAEQAGRDFKQVYLRRVFALAVFGAAHFIFLWQGDILFSYAIGALMLMVVLYARPKPLLITMAVVIGLGCIPDWNPLFGVAGGLAVAGLVALYFRSGKQVKIRGQGIPLFSFLLLLAGSLMSIAAVVFWVLPDGPIEPRLPLSVFGPMLLIAGWLSWKYYEPAEKRSVRLAISTYLFFAMAMTAGGLIQRFAPDPDAGIVIAAQKPAEEGKTAALPAGEKLAIDAAKPVTAAVEPVAAPPAAPPSTPVAAPAAVDAAQTALKTAAPADEKATGKAAAKAAPEADKKAEEKKPKKTKEERAAERKAEREKQLAERKAEKENELRIYTAAPYWESVMLGGSRFPEKVAGDFGFAMVLIGMFLLGVWFVRSGVMENTGAHLPFFRKLALYGLPIGIGLGLLGSLIAMHHTPGDRYDGWGIARGLTTIGNLPACLGYVGMVVLMLHSKSVLSHIRVLGPLGRMALTNYLSQSLICAIYFFGYGLGHWGMPRAQQVLFVAVVYALQIAFSHWWLSKFRYGPMEWLWRGFTYRQIPKFRI